MASAEFQYFVPVSLSLFGIGVAMVHAKRIWSIPLARPKDEEVILLAPGEEDHEETPLVGGSAATEAEQPSTNYAPPQMVNSDDEYEQLSLNKSGDAAPVVHSQSNLQELKEVKEATDENTRVGEGNKFETIAQAISDGANAFLETEYKWISIFCIAFAIILFFSNALSHSPSKGRTWSWAIYTAICYVWGAITSVMCGWIGMQIAVAANSRTAISATKSYGAAFETAMTGGVVMGYALVSVCSLSMFLALNFVMNALRNPWDFENMAHAFAAFGLGGSTVALFGRVGGGIYTKAADVGADLSGKVVEGWDEDDPRNPAVIADNVGDNVGDIAGMGADLFGSVAEASCAYIVAFFSTIDPFATGNLLGEVYYPMALFGVGVLVSYITHLASLHLRPVRKAKDIEPALKFQLLLSTILMTPAALIVGAICIDSTSKMFKTWGCTCAGLWCGLAIGYVTEYFTSFAYKPVQECAEACEAGAAPNVIYGLALGYKSTIIPVSAIALTVMIANGLDNNLGISNAALGILSTIATGLTIDAYGPIADNAGGIAEMAHLHPRVRERTDALDAAGNTTAAIGKGFAIGSAAFVSIALIRSLVASQGAGYVNMLGALTMTGLLFGAMIPYWFSALTMRAVGGAAFDMVKEVQNQLDASTESGRAIREGRALPDYAACVNISTQASLRQMIAPGLLVMATPIVANLLFGFNFVLGVLVGNLISGIQIAISASNSGGAWDNAKKYIRGVLKRSKTSPEHCAAVIGDTVGDPLKDTSGPSINILIKLMAITAIVFPKRNTGLLIELFRKMHLK